MRSIEELYDLALQHHRTGDLARAEPLYRQIIAADPSHAEAHHLLGLVEHQKGHHEVAAGLIRQAIALNPGAAVFHANLGIVLRAQGKTAEAIQSYREALRLNPQVVEAYYNLGNLLRDQGETDQAIASYRQAVKINPRFVAALGNLGVALRDQGKAQEAVHYFQQALQVDPNHAPSYQNLGTALKDLGRSAEALDAFRQAVRCNPSAADAYHNLAISLKDQADTDEAIAACRQAIRLDPNVANYHLTLGIALQDKGCLDEGAASYDRALAIEPAHPSARFCQGLVKLSHGDYLGGWPGYECRWQLPGTKPAYADHPRWDGAPLPGKTILLHAEQGFGDTIQFIRYAALVKERVGRVLFECQPHLVRLLDGVAGVDQILPDNVPPPPFDVQAPLLSLPAIFKTTVATVPTPIPYLRANPALVEQWRRRLEDIDGFKIGIAWQGRPTQKADRYRSAPLSRFEKLARVPGVRLVSLQVGPGAAQIKNVAFDVLDIGSGFNPDSLEDLAAVQMNMDLIVTVDTAVAHLAGALGLPAWVALMFIPDWRWHLEGPTTPWYPQLRLFRQKEPGAWEEVFERIAEELGKRPK
jgi:tetratricopeptide (TPR) repeat protein